MSDYENAFEALVTRGTPIGATALLERIENEAPDVGHLAEPPRQWSGLAVAAAVFAVVLAFGGLWAFLLRPTADVTSTVDQFGVEWIEVSEPNEIGRLLAPGPGGFIRVSGFGGSGIEIEFSPDGHNWSVVNLPGLSSSAWGVAPHASNDAWLAITSENDITSAWTSADGVAWTEVIFPAGLESTIGQITPSGPGFMAVSRDVFGTGTTLLWSEDGAEWTQAESNGPIDINDASMRGTSAGVAWFSNNYSGDATVPVYTTGDGNEWTEGLLERPAGYDAASVRWRLSVIEYLADRWIAIGDVQQTDTAPVPIVWTSTDGVVWTSQETPEFAVVADRAVSMFDSAVVDGRLVVAPRVLSVAVGQDGFVRPEGISELKGELWASEDGAAWVRVLQTEDQIVSFTGTVSRTDQAVGFWQRRPQQFTLQAPVETTVARTAPPQDIDQDGLDLQDEILADGVVTKDEFEQALEGWKSCMEDRGLFQVEFEISPQGGWASSYASESEFAGEAEYAACVDSYVTRVEEAVGR